MSLPHRQRPCTAMSRRGWRLNDRCRRASLCASLALPLVQWSSGGEELHDYLQPTVTGVPEKICFNYPLLWTCSQHSSQHGHARLPEPSSLALRRVGLTAAVE